MPVCSNKHTVRSDIVKDELVSVAAEVMQARLNDVVSVEIADQGDQVLLQGSNHKLLLELLHVAVSQDSDQALHSSGAMTVEADLCQRWSQKLHYLIPASKVLGQSDVKQ